MDKQEVRLYLWEIGCDDPPFRMLGSDPIEAAMVWLSTKEAGAPVRLPTILFIDNLSVPRGNPGDGVVALTSYLLRQRDQERERRGLPPYWDKLADHLKNKHGGLKGAENEF